MGTSNAYGGPGGNTPLVPSWLGPDVSPAAPPGAAPDTGGPVPLPIPVAPNLPPVPVAADPDRFLRARNSFTRFAGSGGTDRKNLGKAVSRYVSTSSGGRRAAARRMGSSIVAGANLLGFLANAVASTPREALRALNLENLAGRPIEEVFLGLMEYVCPNGGTVDEGIAREAFVETIASLAENGLTNFDALTVDQMQTIFELFAANSIEARLCNDIGTKAIILPIDVAAAANVQAQLRDFVRRSVSDALTRARATMEGLTPDRVLGFVNEAYEQAFGILQSLGEAAMEEE